MAERPDLWRHAALTDEGVVARHRTVGVEAHDLAQVRLHVLRGIVLLPLAGTDEELAAGAEDQAVAVVSGTDHLRYLPPDYAQVGQAAAAAGEIEPRTRDRGATGAVGPGFGVTQIDQPVACEL